MLQPVVFQFQFNKVHSNLKHKMSLLVVAAGPVDLNRQWPTQGFNCPIQKIVQSRLIQPHCLFVCLFVLPFSGNKATQVPMLLVLCTNYGCVCVRACVRIMHDKAHTHTKKKNVRVWKTLNYKMLLPPGPFSWECECAWGRGRENIWIGVHYTVAKS